MPDKIMIAAIALSCCLAAPFACRAQKTNKPAPLMLRIEYADKINPNLSLCSAVGFDDPIEFSWTRYEIESTLVVSLRAPEDGVYRLEFGFRQETPEATKYQTGGKFFLKLNKSEQRTDVASSLTEDIYDWKIVLSKKPCR